MAVDSSLDRGCRSPSAGAEVNECIRRERVIELADKGRCGDLSGRLGLERRIGVPRQSESILDVAA